MEKIAHRIDGHYAVLQGELTLQELKGVLDGLASDNIQYVFCFEGLTIWFISLGSVFVASYKYEDKSKYDMFIKRYVHADSDTLTDIDNQLLNNPDVKCINVFQAY